MRFPGHGTGITVCPFEKKIVRFLSHHTHTMYKYRSQINANTDEK